MNIKLIVTDLDNTLLRRDKTISDYTRDVFARCRECGSLFAHATSRSAGASQRYSDMTLPDIRITCGGAIAAYGDLELYRATFDQADTTRLLTAFAAEPNVAQITMTSDTSYYNSEEIIREAWILKDWSGAIYIPQEEMADRITESAQKFAINCVHIDSLIAACAGVDDVNVQAHSGDPWCDVTRSNARKHLALANVMKQLGIAPFEVVVFGDDYNDIDMLSLPGVVSVAVANAIPEVKAVASNICGDCDEDGVAKWLEENLLCPTA
jgi:Cof subfamily protein (haloacid dehalogenase superfamily)